jgi:hypothetical protein
VASATARKGSRHPSRVRLSRHCAGVRLTRSQTTPQSLAATVVAGYGRVANYPAILVDGAHGAAEEILSLVG